MGNRCKIERRQATPSFQLTVGLVVVSLLLSVLFALAEPRTPIPPNAIDSKTKNITVQAVKEDNQTSQQLILSVIWLAFSVVLAILPLLITPPLSVLFGEAKIPFNSRLVKDGELFFFSSSLSAATIGKSIGLIVRKEPTPHVLIIVALLFILILSAFCFGGAVTTKPRRNASDQSPSIQAPVEDSTTITSAEQPVMVARASISLAALAVIFSFVAFWQGGFK